MVFVAPDVAAKRPSDDAPLDERPASETPAALATLQRCLADLAPDLATLYRHRYIDGRSQEAAAAMMGLTRQSLRTLEEKLRRGLAQALVPP